MRIGNRLFPYPILNRVSINSTYKQDFAFEISYSERVDDENDMLILEDIYCKTNSSLLSSLISESKAEVVLLFECSQSFYRTKINISLKPTTIVFQASKITGSYTVSAFVVAKEDILLDPSNGEFSDEYSDFPSIQIEKHDILAVDEGHTNRMRHSADDDIKKSSIFSIVCMDKYKEGRMTFETKQDVIVIYLSKELFEHYCALSRLSSLNNIFYSMFAISALIQSIQKIIKSYVNKGYGYDEAISTAADEYDWFSAFIAAYKKKYDNADFTEDDLDQLEEITQNLFDYPCGSAIDSVSKLVSNQGGVSND